MNKLIALLLVSFAVVACSNEEIKEKKPKKDLPLVEVVDGVYTEYYPERKAIKMQGPLDEDSLRNGKWALFAENGVELSVTHYIHGKKEGHSIVKYPNGMIYYYGEYRNDVKVGLWKTYDSKGKIAKEENFGGM